jgi:predicted RNA-binding protein
MFAVNPLDRDLNQIFVEAQKLKTSENLEHLGLFFEKAMSMTSSSRSKSEAFMHRPKVRDETMILNELPGILMRVFRTEHDNRDEKFPSWLDIIDHNLHEYRT